MTFAKVFSAQTSLLKPNIVEIEVDLSKGLHSFSIVGLPDKAVEESRDRISAAIKNSGFKSPKNKNQKVVISLAPADIKKEGPSFDLGMALAYLLASEDIKFDPAGKIFLGELSLDGNVRSINGVLPLIREAKEKGFTEAFVPLENAKEAALIEGITVYGSPTLKEVAAHLDTRSSSQPNKAVPDVKLTSQPVTTIEYTDTNSVIDFADIKSQEAAKRGLEIAAAGGHNVVMFGPPGTGKTMLAKAFCGILPPLSFDEILEVTSIHSVAGALKEGLVTHPPFRSPHHTSSYVSLVGGGTFPKPGEVTLAHRGVLFLDEFPEFDRRVIDSLRQPLEDRVISISRAKGSVLFPARFILIAAMNPCSCGNFGIEGKECLCSPLQLSRYQRKISGPIIHRVDIWLEVSKVDHTKLSDTAPTGEDSRNVRERIAQCRKKQEERYKAQNISTKTNGELSAKDINRSIPLSEDVRSLLNDWATKLDISARSYHRIVKLARTIADLDQSEHVRPHHILEAIQYRPKRSITTTAAY